MPSAHQIDDVVDIFLPQKSGHFALIKGCEVDAIRFFVGKVRYDVFVNLEFDDDHGDEEHQTYIDNVDGSLIRSDKTKTPTSPELDEMVKGYLQAECAVVVNDQPIFGGQIFCVIFKGGTVYFDVAIPYAENPNAYYWLKEVHSGNVLTSDDLAEFKTRKNA